MTKIAQIMPPDFGLKLNPKSIKIFLVIPWRMSCKELASFAGLWLQIQTATKCIGVCARELLDCPYAHTRYGKGTGYS
jgi:hypothetical protein